MADIHILNVQKSQDSSKVYYNDPLGNAKRKGDAKYIYDDMCNKNAGASKLVEDQTNVYINVVTN